MCGMWVYMMLLWMCSGLCSKWIGMWCMVLVWIMGLGTLYGMLYYGNGSGVYSMVSYGMVWLGVVVLVVYGMYDGDNVMVMSW